MYFMHSGKAPPIPKSIVSFLLNCGKGKRLQKLLLQCSNHFVVQEVPRVYDGFCSFELPPTYGKGSNMESMQQKI